MLTENHAKAINAMVKEIIKHDAKGLKLADTLWSLAHDAKTAGASVEEIWVGIATKHGYADKVNKIEGETMPQTLLTYRAVMRRGEKLGVSLQLSYTAFRKEIERLAGDEGKRAPHHKANETTKTETDKPDETTKPEAEVFCISSAQVRAISDKRKSLSLKERDEFDVKLMAFIAAYGV